MRKIIVLPLAIAGLMAGCASLSEDQCRQGDWTAIGQADGYAGEPMSRLQDHREACARVGVTPDVAAYSRGRQTGLRGYCTVARGFAEGRQGHSYAGVCPPGVAAPFMAAYNDGRIVFAAVTRQNTAANARASAESRARELGDNIRKARDKLASSKTSAAEKDALNKRINRMRDDRREAMDRARDADSALRDAEAETSALRYRFAARYPAW